MDRDMPILPQLRSKFDSSQSYGLDKIDFSLFSSAYEFAETVAFLFLGFAPYVWDMSAVWSGEYMGWNEREDEIKVTLVFLALTTAIGTVTGLPFELASPFCFPRFSSSSSQF